MNTGHIFQTWFWPAVVGAVVGLAVGLYIADRLPHRPAEKTGQSAMAAHGAADECDHCAQDPPKGAAANHDAHAHDEAGAHAHGHALESEAEPCADEVTLSTEALRANFIRVEPARKTKLEDAYTAPARISYNLEQMAHVGTPVAGRVVEIHARLGDAVKTGDVLLIIDSPALGEAQSDLLQKKTQVEVAQAALEVTKTAAERARKLLGDQGVSLGEYQKREGDLRAAEGALRAAQAALTAAENRLHLLGFAQADIEQLLHTGEINPRYRVCAPLSGWVIEREVTLGEMVTPERDALLVLANLSTLWVLADVPEHLLHRVHAGSSATIRLPAIKGQTFSGRISHIATSLDRATRTGQVRIEVRNGHLPLKPGMFAQVEMPLTDETGRDRGAVLAVPEAAVQIVEGGPAVFVVAECGPNTFAKQPVKVGPTVRGLVPILEGLEEGRSVVVEGAFLLKAELAKAIMEGKTCTGH
ncbi:MAG: efflux RND transporter periplasmic adaptor subunit [Candidatus Sumerlaeia bacterium]|nr:efflux RND transporter periplasmic adaptor subunit [Candidatus Sumerlaeia bacterium]